MADYVVLRDAAATSFEPFGKPFSGAVVAGGANDLERPVPKIEAETLSRAEVRDMVRDRGVKAIAPVIPMTLIQPVEGDGAAPAASANTWGVEAVLAHQSPYTGDGVTVAVLDTGIDRAHPAFADVDIVEADFSGDGNGDVHGHGTHCAGTIFGGTVAGTRIGVAPGVKRALIGKVLGNSGGGDSLMSFRGLKWAVDQGANVISMSLGFDFPGLVARLSNSMPIEAATSSALEAYRANLRMFDTLMRMIQQSTPFGLGAIVVAASGNESKKPQYEIAASMPAAAEGVLAIGAVRQNLQSLEVAPFSNTFPQLVAPGVGVLSARAGAPDRGAFNGTSKAPPPVAGVAALWWEARQSLDPRLTAQSVAAELVSNARNDVFAPNEDPADYGFGLVTAPLQ